MSTPTSGFGLVLRDLPGCPHDRLDAALQATANLGASALQVPSITWLSATLDVAELRRVGSDVAARDMELTATLGTLNACWPDRMSAVMALGDGNVDIGIERAIRGAVTAGIPALHVTCGQLEDKTAVAPRWSEQLERNAELVARAARMAAGEGISLVLKTHEEMSSWEAMSIAEASNGTVRLGFSPVNLLIGMEDPVLAAGRVAAMTHTVFVDDAALYRTDTGLRRSMQAVGDGVIDWPGVFGVLASTNGLHVTLDLHRASFDIPLFSPDWPRAHSDISLDDLSRVFGRTTSDETPDATVEHRFSVGVHAIRSIFTSEKTVV